jgi:plasmid stabilization system protein ParE
MIARLSKAATADIRSIATWIAKDRPIVARRIALEIQAACRALSDTPVAYPRVEGVLDGLFRRRPLGRYTIYYRVLPDEVLVVRIVDGARNTTDLL